MPQGPTLVACAVGALVAALAGDAAAQQPRGFAIDRVEPSERGSEWFVLDAIDIEGRLRPAVGISSAWTYRPLVLRDVTGQERTLVEHQVFLHPGATLIFASRVRVSFSGATAVYQTGDSIAGRAGSYPSPEGARGDLRLSSDVRVFGRRREGITGAAGAALHVPNGARASYTSDGTFRISPRVAIAGDLGRYTYAARLGFAYRSLDDAFEPNRHLGSELTFGVAAGIRLVEGALLVGPEIYGSTILDETTFLSRRGTPVGVLAGAHWTIRDFRVGAGIGTGITRAWGSPALAMFWSAEWAPKDTPVRRAPPGPQPRNPSESEAPALVRSRPPSGSTPESEKNQPPAE